MHIPDPVLMVVECATALAGLLLLFRGVRLEHWRAIVSGAVLGALPGVLLLTSGDFRAFAEAIFGRLDLIEIGLMIAVLGGWAGFRLGPSSEQAIGFIAAGVAGAALAALPAGYFLSHQSTAILAIVGFFLFGFSGRKVAPLASAVDGALLLWLGGAAVLARWWPSAASEISANRTWTLISLGVLAAGGTLFQQGARGKSSAGPAAKKMPARAAA